MEDDILKIKVRLDLYDGEFEREVSNKEIPDMLYDLIIEFGATEIAEKRKGKRSKIYVKDYEETYIDENSMTKELKYKRAKY